MAKIQKPQISDKLQTRLRLTEQALKQGRTTKAELVDLLGLSAVPHGERIARMIVAHLGKTRAVISTSKRKGYYIDTKDTDEAFVEMYDCLMELGSRIENIMERVAPLERSFAVRARRRGLKSSLDIKAAIEEYRRKLNGDS